MQIEFTFRPIHFALIYTTLVISYEKPSTYVTPCRLVSSTLIHTEFQHYHGFEFMEQLVSDMVQDDPDKRPTIAEAHKRFDELHTQLSTWTLRRRLVHRGEGGFARFVLGTVHFAWNTDIASLRSSSSRGLFPVPRPKSTNAGHSWPLLQLLL